MFINMTGGDHTGLILFRNFTPNGDAQVYRYSPADLTKIVHLANQPVTTADFSATFPANSITLVVIPASAGPGPDPDPTPAAGLYLPLTQR